MRLRSSPSNHPENLPCWWVVVSNTSIRFLTEVERKDSDVGDISWTPLTIQLTVAVSLLVTWSMNWLFDWSNTPILEKVEGLFGLVNYSSDFGLSVVNWGFPSMELSKMVGWFHGKSHLQMDDGGPGAIFGKHHGHTLAGSSTKTTSVWSRGFLQSACHRRFGNWEVI